jgi:predicted transcriptional regulator
VKKATHFKTLREFVDSHPRTVRQGQIALKLGLSEQLLSAYLGGRVPGRGVALRLSREHHIDLEGLLDPDGARHTRVAS